jgi:hypothetical protein
MPIDAAALLLVLAAPPEPAIDWSAPAGCPGQAEVLAQARALIGDPTEAAMREVAIRGAIEATPVGFSLDIDVRTPSGTTHKTAYAGDCTVLGGVAALMVAVAVDPVQTADTLHIGAGRAVEAPASAAEAGLETGAAIPSPDDAPPPDAARRPSEPQPAPRDAAPVPVAAADAAPAALPRARSVRGFARVSGSIGSGLVPELDAGLAAGAGLLAAYLRAELVAFHVFARDARYPAPSTAGASIAAWGGSLRVGPRVRLRTVELHALGGLTVAALTASGFGARNARNEADAWIALALLPGVRWEPIPRLAVGADLEAEAALRRPAFLVSGSPELYRAARVGLRGSVVVELRWGNRPGR